MTFLYETKTEDWSKNMDRKFAECRNLRRGEPVRLLSYESEVQREMVMNSQINERVTQGNIPVYVELCNLMP